MLPFGLDGANLNDAKSYVVSVVGPGPVKKREKCMRLEINREKKNEKWTVRQNQTRDDFFYP